MAWQRNKQLPEAGVTPTSLVMVRCPNCNGAGRDPGFRTASKCAACGGRGKVRKTTLRLRHW